MMDGSRVKSIKTRNSKPKNRGKFNPIWGRDKRGRHKRKVHVMHISDG